MPKPQRCRRICKEPAYSGFSPDGICEAETVSLFIDEFEVIRLVDYEKKTHKECAELMDISRTTVTEIYESARRKIADSIVNGKHLLIEGGNYRICDGSAFSHCGKNCGKQRKFADEAAGMSAGFWTEGVTVKGENVMRIAVTYEDGMIFQHFGHTEQFKIYDIANGSVTASQVLDTNGSGHGALAGFLEANQVDALICGGIGGGAQAALAESGIKLYGGVSGNADEAVQALLSGNLGYDPDVHCSHHDQEHGDGGHTCGSHGCGSHSCQ